MIKEVGRFFDIDNTNYTFKNHEDNPITLTFMVKSYMKDVVNKTRKYSPLINSILFLNSLFLLIFKSYYLL